MSLGMDIVNGLHEFISEDSEFKQQAKKYRVKLYDIRKPLANRYLHLFTGDIFNVKTPQNRYPRDRLCRRQANDRDAADCRFKRTRTSGQLYRYWSDLINSGNTGIALDAIPSEFMTGELENAAVRA